MTNSQWAEGLVLWARRRGVGARTVRNYPAWANLFEEFLRQQGISDFRQATREILARFPGYLMTLNSSRGKPYATITRCLILSWVKKLYQYLQAEGYLLIDPASCLKFPRLGRRLPRSLLTVPEMKRLLLAPDVTKTWGLRDRAILELLYGAGLRFSELVDLTVGDVDVVERVLWVRQGKGGKDRVLPLGRWAAYWLAKYLAESDSLRRKQGTERVFLTPRGNRLANWVINTQLRVYARASGISKPITLHSLRHTFATHLLKYGADLRKLQRLLGHALLSTTQVYTHLDLEDLRQVQRRCHPRERG